MDSLPDNFRALIFGATGAIGGALVTALQATPNCATVAGLGRTTKPALDLLDEPSLAAAAAALSAEPWHLIINATGALSIDGHGPEKRLADLNGPLLARAFAINAIGPALLLKHFAPLLPQNGRSIFATLSARVGSIGDNRLGGWYGYRASKAALNQLFRTAAIEIARKRPDAMVLCLHPGTVRSALSTPIIGQDRGNSPAEAAAALLRVMNAVQKTGTFTDQHGTPVAW